MTRIVISCLGIAALMLSAGCSTGSDSRSPDVTGAVKDSLKAAGLKDVSVSQDRDKGVVTLKGSVASDADKARAESLAKSVAAGQVVGNEIAVLPAGGESTAKSINADLDAAIKKNLDAALLQNRMHDDVKYDVDMGVVTLTGAVVSQARRDDVQRVAMGVPNVKQVINKLDVKNQKASSSN